MAKEYSPFTPGSPVMSLFFVGREKEVDYISDAIGKSIAQNTIERLFVEGIRGIGKSSLCSYAMAKVEKEQNVLVVNASLGGVHTLNGFVRHIFDAIVQIQGSSKWYVPIISLFKDHVESVDIFGVNVRLKASDEQIETMVSDFPNVLRGLFNKIPEESRPDGIVFVLDDINGLASDRAFAEWFKSVSDRIAIDNGKGARMPVTFIFIGIPERRQSMIESQPSLDRVFDLVRLGVVSQGEAGKFFAKTFESVNVKIEQDAIDMLVNNAQGYPVFMHEIGDAVFKADEDGLIDAADAAKGVFAAIRIIGDKYIEPVVLHAVSSDNYRRLLSHLATYWRQYPDDMGRIKRANIAKTLQEQTSVHKSLDNFLKKMVSLGVIHRVQGISSGTYEFSNYLYALYFALFMQNSNKVVSE